MAFRASQLSVASAPSQLFTIRPALEFHRFNRGRGSHGQAEYVAANPPDGAILTYYIGARPGGGAPSFPDPPAKGWNPINPDSFPFEQAKPKMKEGMSKLIADLKARAK